MSAPVLIGLLIASVAIAYVIAPLIWPRAFVAATPEPASLEPDETHSLLALRDEILAAIVDLDFENAIGKTDEEEYQEERAALKRRALTVIRALDAREGERAALDETVEREIRDARARRVAANPPAVTEEETPELYDEVERQVRALRRTRGADVARAE
jgi:integrase